MYICPKSEWTFLHACASRWVTIIAYSCNVIAIAINYTCYVVGSHAYTPNVVAKFKQRTRTSNYAFICAVCSKIEIRTFFNAKIRNVICISNCSICICPTIWDTWLCRVLCPRTFWTDTDTTMSRTVCKCTLTRWAITDATASQVICKLWSIARVDTQTTAILSKGSLSAPINATSIQSISIVVSRRCTIKAWTLWYTKVGSIVAELAKEARIDAYSVMWISICLRLTWTHSYASLSRIVCKSRWAKGNALIDCII